MSDFFTDPVLPQYFYVPFGSVEEEREAPGSQHRVASNHGAVRELLHLNCKVYLVTSRLRDRVGAWCQIR